MRGKPRFCEPNKDSPLSKQVYERLIPQDHFLVQLEKFIDWDSFPELLLSVYPGKGLIGRPPYPPVMILKMLFLSYLYNISERRTEELVDFHIVVKWFVGLGIEEKAPNHSTLSYFKKGLIEKGAGIY